MAFSYMNTDSWHERIERAFRGVGKSGAQRDYLHRCVKHVFSHFERRWAAKGYTALELLRTYEALVHLFPHCMREEEHMFYDAIEEFRLVMVDRLNNQIEPEMHPSFATREPEAWDLVALFKG